MCMCMCGLCACVIVGFGCWVGMLRMCLLELFNTEHIFDRYGENFCPKSYMGCITSYSQSLPLCDQFHQDIEKSKL
jgi:hypothetical protein